MVVVTRFLVVLLVENISVCLIFVYIASVVVVLVSMAVLLAAAAAEDTEPF